MGKTMAKDDSKSTPRPDPKADRPLYSPDEARDYLDSFLAGEKGVFGRETAPADHPAGELGSGRYPKRLEPEPGSLLERVIQVLQTIFDPEIDVSIYDLGLIYDVVPAEDGTIKIVMTLTTPNCPVAEAMPMDVQYQVGCLEGVQSVDLELVWDPPWGPSMMSDEAQLKLGLL